MGVQSLDNTDIKILGLLQQNARLSNKEIAYQTNKSVSAIQVRIRRLAESGYIKKFVTLLDRSKLEMELIVFTTIKLSDYSSAALKQFQETAGSFKEVMECYHMSGSRDFILKVVVKNMAAYNVFILEKLSHMPHIGNVESLFVISETKYETAFTLD